MGLYGDFIYSWDGGGGGRIEIYAKGWGRWWPQDKKSPDGKTEQDF